jgi:hypothetical protein
MKRTRTESSYSKLRKPDCPVWQTELSGAPPGFDEVCLLRPRDVWMEEKKEPRQLKKLWWRIVDLIDKKEKETKN